MEKTREREPGAVVLAEDVVLSRFREKPLAALLLSVLDRKELTSLAPRLGLNPLPGKRLKTMKPADHALLLARSTLEVDAARGPILEALNARLPPPLLSPEERPSGPAVDVALRLAEDLPPDRRAALVLSLLGDDEATEKALAALEDGLLESDDARGADAEAAAQRLTAKLAREKQRADDAEKQREGEKRSVHARENGLKQRIDELQRELSELQQRLGDKNREYDLLHKEWETLKGDLRVAFNRAARFKNALDEAKSASERENELKSELVRARQRADIADMKLEILEYQLDILEQDEPEEAPADATEDDALPERVLAFVEAVGRPPRVLVVGGAGKQRTHRERDFRRLVDTLGVEGEWRFADYTSWHRELPRLKNDMRDRFDLVFVLHWNRTTFVQKMHDEARAANARVRTVPYVGFLSLEKAVREEVERFVAERI
ncbi:MAG: hypothetical protein ACF8XB_02540 [Planctomycetota bacterium JB042]